MLWLGEDETAGDFQGEGGQPGRSIIPAAPVKQGSCPRWTIVQKLDLFNKRLDFHFSSGTTEFSTLMPLTAHQGWECAPLECLRSSTPLVLY